MLLERPIKIARKVLTKYEHSRFVPYHGYVEFSDYEANELVRNELMLDKPSMICKIGTTELSCVCNYLSIKGPKKIGDILKYIRREKKYLWWWETHMAMANLSGLFPATPKMAERFCELMLDDLKYIDILGSYIKDEILLKKELSHTKRINLEGYYTPFCFENPWTEILEGKKVLVVHPFEESVINQYKKRDLIFSNPKVLPKFELSTIKAVQTIANNSPEEYKDWFEALNYMKDRISNTEFDIALIGCGAYGLPLAAHVKRIGKKAVHLAGWTQILFGIYGKRWQRDKVISKFINEHWVKPLPSEVPLNFKKVERGCYW